jgi:multicomponent Na+:H+ antiporter subunit A
MEGRQVTSAEVLLAATLALPIGLLAACLSRRVVEKAPVLVILAPLPALAAALTLPAGTALALPNALFGLTLVLDGPGAVLLGASAVLWTAAAVYARSTRQNGSDSQRFAVWWLITLVGNLGVFIAADLVSFFIFFTISSLAAYGLIVHDATAEARRAGAVYIALAVLGEALLLMGLVLAGAGSEGGSLLIRDVVAGFPASPLRNAALTFLVLGFGLKIGLVPLHVWMPLTYTAAPIAAAAVLSGAAVKAGVIGFIRFLPLETALPAWGEALAAIGFVSAFYGAVVGLTQSNPRTVLAYSSVSQMGLLATVLGMALAAGDGAEADAAAFYAMHHVLVKGGLFLAIGVAAVEGGRRWWPVLFPAAVLALALAGLPLTGGALAKTAIKAPLGGGIAGALATVSAIASTILMLHFLRCLRQVSPQVAAASAPAGLVAPWLAVAAAAVALPWAIYPAVANMPLQAALAPAALWEALWPVLVGALLAVVLQHRLPSMPRVPPGDVLTLAMRATPAADRLAAAAVRIDDRLLEWPVAGVLLVALTLVLAAALLSGT